MILMRRGWLVLLFVGILVPVRVSAQEASIEMVYQGDRVIEGDELDVEVWVSTEEATIGTDVVLQYDEEMLGLIEVIPGDVYPNNSEVDVDKMEKGEIVFSGVAEIGNPVIPDGVLMLVVFEALSDGQTEISILQEDGSTIGTGIVPYEGIEDSLEMGELESLWVEIERASWWQRVVSWVRGLI